MPKAESKRFADRKEARFDPVKSATSTHKVVSNAIFSHLSDIQAKKVGHKYCFEVCVAVKVQSGQDAIGEHLRIALKVCGVGLT